MLNVYVITNKDFVSRLALVMKKETILTIYIHNLNIQYKFE